MKQKLAFGERVNKWLDEPEGSIFRNGKWRFWFPMLIGFSLLNAILTASIFGSNAQAFFGSITLAVGALIAWLCIGTLHYSDSRDARLSKGVAFLDSITLCFVIAHFCFLLWAQGHLMTLKGQEDEYKASAMAYNEKTEKLSSDNVKIAEAGAQAEKEKAKAAKLQNDTAYQLRRAAETGNVARARIAPGLKDQSSPSLSLAPIELEKPKKPEQSSAAFLMKWDSWIRAANFGELILAAITFIFIRNRSSRFNAQCAASSRDEVKRDEVKRDDDFPSELDGIEESSRLRDGRPSLVSRHNDKETTRVATQAQKIRECLKDFSFYLPGHSFKVDVKADYVWLRMMRAEKGIEQTIAATKATREILNDVERMEPGAFKARLATFLKKRGFPINVEKAGAGQVLEVSSPAPVSAPARARRRLPGP